MLSKIDHVYRLFYSLLCLLILSTVVAIAIAISVAIAIVSIAMAAVIHAIEDRHQVLVPLLNIVALNVAQHRLVEQASTNHEDGHVHKLVDDGRVGNNIDRRTVDKHVIILGLHLRNELFQTVVK